MAELAQGTQPEFWRPPTPTQTEEITVRESLPTMAEACPGCGTEYLLGSRFCHACGGRRPAMSSADQANTTAVAGVWEQAVTRIRSSIEGFSWDRIPVPAWLHYLHFHEIQSWTGLSTGSLIAFVIGLACVAGALLVGLLTAKTLVDWQAIQFYRAECLLAATAAFVAGILLKKQSSTE